MTILGLTGNIASGKSTVARLLAERGAAVIDCDALAHEVTAPGTPGLTAVIERFGPDIVTPAGELDRAKLAARVFADPAELAALEAIVHPLVRRRRDELLAQTAAPVAVVEAIKLFESGFADECDAVWVVTAPEPERLRRLVSERGMDPAAAAARLAAQGDDSWKLTRAAEVITNDGDLAVLAERVAAAWGRWALTTRPAAG